MIGKTKGGPKKPRAKRPPWPRVPPQPGPAVARALELGRANAERARKQLAAAAELLAGLGCAPQHITRLRTECARDAATECLEWLGEVAELLKVPWPNPAHQQGPEPAQKRRQRAEEPEPTRDELEELPA